MTNTHVRSIRDLYDNYAELAEIVMNNDQVIITNNDRYEAVQIGMEEYAMFEEYAHMRYFAERLAEAEAVAADSSSKHFSHEEFWRELGFSG